MASLAEEKTKVFHYCGYTDEYVLVVVGPYEDTFAEVRLSRLRDPFQSNAQCEVSVRHSIMVAPKWKLASREEVDERTAIHARNEKHDLTGLFFCHPEGLFLATAGPREVIVSSEHDSLLKDLEKWASLDYDDN